MGRGTRKAPNNRVKAGLVGVFPLAAFAQIFTAEVAEVRGRWFIGCHSESSKETARWIEERKDAILSAMSANNGHAQAAARRLATTMVGNGMKTYRHFIVAIFCISLWTNCRAVENIDLATQAVRQAYCAIYMKDESMFTNATTGANPELSVITFKFLSLSKEFKERLEKRYGFMAATNFNKLMGRKYPNGNWWIRLSYWPRDADGLFSNLKSEAVGEQIHVHGGAVIDCYVEVAHGRGCVILDRGMDATKLTTSLKRESNMWISGIELIKTNEAKTIEGFVDDLSERLKNKFSETINGRGP